MSIEQNIVPVNKNQNTEIYKVEEIKQKIYTIRGKQVILDSDIANLYEVETKRINETVKRNQKRFPREFCFQLTELEFENLRSQFATSSLNTKKIWRKKIFTICFYRTRCCNVICSFT